MKFKLTKASDWEFEEQVEVSSLQELEALQNKFERPRDPSNSSIWGWERPSLVVYFFKMVITVYDYYME